MSITSKELHGLYRTFYPKYAHYMSDGMGRDTYILKHNGGMCSEGSRPYYETTMYTREKPSAMGPAPLKEATSFKYISDGSGRDFYVTYNSGGLEAPYIPGTVKSDQNFILSLRSGLKTSQQKRLSTPSEKQRMKKWRSAQRLLIKRLTATSQEWKEINREAKRLSISRERDARSPVVSQSTQFNSYQLSRNTAMSKPQMHDSYQNLPIQNKNNYAYPIYTRSTRNTVNTNVKNSSAIKAKNKQIHSNFLSEENNE